MDLKIPARPEKGHKGTFGTVAIAAGSISEDKVMLGSAALAGKAAIRSGAGICVFLGTRELLFQLIRLVPQAVGIVYPGDFEQEAKKWQSIVVGPGLGVNKANISLIRDILKLKLPTVIDADGLNTMAEYPELFQDLHEFCVLTPHPKEFARLSRATSTSDARQLAARSGCTVVLKSSDTLITDGRQEWSKKVDNPVLGTGGTGDLLSGLIAGLMAQYINKLSTVECARLAVEVQAQAAQNWRGSHGSGGLILDELLELIPETIDNLRLANRSTQ